MLERLQEIKQKVVDYHINRSQRFRDDWDFILHYQARNPREKTNLLFGRGLIIASVPAVAAGMASSLLTPVFIGTAWLSLGILHCRWLREDNKQKFSQSALESRIIETV